MIAQNASTTFQNIKLVLDDIIVVQKEMGSKNLKHIVDICDGYSVQYKYGATLYSLTITVTTRKCIVFRCVKCHGHGKCRCDSEGGIFKARDDIHFDSFVAISDGTSDGIPVHIHRVQDGTLLRLANVILSVLDVDNFRFGAHSYSSRAR